MVINDIEQTERDTAEEQCLPHLLMERVREHPDRTAVVHGSELLSYRDLAVRSAGIADDLRNLGVVPDDSVGIFVEPSIALMTSVWGVLLAGGAYLPLSPEYPEERLRYMIEDSGVRVVITSEDLRPQLSLLAPPGTRIICPESPESPAVFGAPGGPPPEWTAPAGLTPDRLAYVIYTSGSTGKPKGVMIEQRSIVHQMRWLAESGALDRSTTVLQKTPMSFDAAQWEILAPVCGSRVVVGAPGLHRDPERIIETVIAHRVTALQCVPTLLQALLDTEEFSSCTSLTRVFSGGEALSGNLAEKFLDTLPGSALTNLYGPTETTVNASAFTVDRRTLAESPQMVPIGRPVPGTRFHILDGDRKPVGAGEVGELYIGGVQLARGYLNRPELTAERFIAHTCDGEKNSVRLYRTGDLAHWSDDGTVRFAGRADNQIKLRGFRVELDEIRLAIETHDWVKNAAVLVKEDPATGFQNLIACIELSPKEAALMDQGSHGAHHQSKESKLQVRAQLANPGTRDDRETGGRKAVDLPGRTPTPEQRRLAFARKTYRSFEGGEVTAADLLALLAGPGAPAAESRDISDLDLAGLGELLRNFGQFLSEERLLPKYAYASPGALYATQLYLETDGLPFLAPGFHYYHPVEHRLILITPRTGAPEQRARIRLHFVGKRRAIEPVYKNNILEVLEIEAGHMAGLFDRVLPAHGLGLEATAYEPAAMDHLDCAEEDFYLGTFEMLPLAAVRPRPRPDIYVQAHAGKVTGLPEGQYRYRNGVLDRVSDALVHKRHVIAINQQVYEKAAFGITVISRAREAWLDYADLGRELQHLQMNGLRIGLMSSGYSSKTGHDLPAATRMAGILGALGESAGASYFAVGGRISEGQLRSEGMREDIVHMKGPAEIIREDLSRFLPDYMMPNRVVVMDGLPLSANGKIDVKALESSDRITALNTGRVFVAPRTRTEERIRDIWEKVMKQDGSSVQDDFFASGGNSLLAVGLVNRINRAFGSALPLQILFDSPTIEKLARALESTDTEPASRLVRLHTEGAGNPVFCWPGLGGYTMNLRPLAGELGIGRPFYGVQSYGINPGEIPYATIQEMAAADVRAIERLQRNGPYTLWGYSFGARVAFEAAHQIERAGGTVENLFLLAPGSPVLPQPDGGARPHGDDDPVYTNKAYVRILHSVFAGTITGEEADACVAHAEDDESFTEFIRGKRPELDAELVGRIIRIVRRTFQLRYTFQELRERKVKAPITLFKARGDDYSFIESSSGYSEAEPTVVELACGHYTMLRSPGLNELTQQIRHRLSTGRRLPIRKEETVVPHVNIKHFPVPLSEDQQSELVAAVTRAVTSAFRCDEGAISVALEPVEKEVWNERVYIPEIVQRKNLLLKTPNY
ncbi:amino acid adenylation domain-containing protein [Streptomyces sp. NPDC057554]|uniref:amino acid adenylation domain-containing protein n=1 Tax=Streptomyces sp. NPDC057554 TaxID=3350538 RepID=UPI0036A76B3C